MPDVPFRENFARVCFEALLQFSFIHNKEATLGKKVAVVMFSISVTCLNLMTVVELPISVTWSSSKFPIGNIKDVQLSIV